MPSSRVVSVALLISAMVAPTGCDQPAPDLREWTSEDHDHQSEPRRRRRKPSSHRKPSKSGSQLVSVTWLNQCAECHGKKGRGDGPKSPMVKAKDLTEPSFQSMVTDEAMAKIIKEGRDKMPAFDLPDSTIQGLVDQIREFGKARRQRERRRSTRPASTTEGAVAPASATLPASPDAADESPH